VTREAIEIVLSALAGGDPTVSAAALKEMGFDASALDTARPDDIVIFSYSGHGWADPQGNFYLLPTDTKWTPGSKIPDLASLMSSDNLSVYFTAIKAAEIAIIIDACHSGASVDAGGFKPGPMGDSGLGQLAFDKGIRILAASQAADVALEDAVLRQGLLTYALAGEGITSDGGKADADRDGRITLDEWLRYAVQRLPGLSEDVRVGRFGAPGTSASRDFDLLDATPAARPKPQEPALFDFNGQASPVVLRDLRR
jgi:Caspase domain